MWTFQISAGAITDPKGAVLTREAYSGHPPHVNDPHACGLKDVGPLPPGLYRIGGMTEDGRLGPCIMALTPVNVPGIGERGGFYIHGDNAAQDHTGSDGCIVAPLAVRKAVVFSSDDQLLVVP